MIRNPPRSLSRWRGSGSWRDPFRASNTLFLPSMPESASSMNSAVPGPPLAGLATTRRIWNRSPSRERDSRGPPADRLGTCSARQDATEDERGTILRALGPRDAQDSRSQNLSWADPYFLPGPTACRSRLDAKHQIDGVMARPLAPGELKRFSSRRLWESRPRKPSHGRHGLHSCPERTSPKHFGIPRALQKPGGQAWPASEAIDARDQTWSWSRCGVKDAIFRVTACRGLETK